MRAQRRRPISRVPFTSMFTPTLMYCHCVFFSPVEDEPVAIGILELVRMVVTLSRVRADRSGVGATIGGLAVGTDFLHYKEQVEEMGRGFGSLRRRRSLRRFLRADCAAAENGGKQETEGEDESAHGFSLVLAQVGHFE